MSTDTYANSAFQAANSAGSYANSAFITANTANAAINTKTTINALNFLSVPSSNTQNTIFLVVDLQTGTPTTRKMSLSVLSERSANFAFEAANSAGSYANSAFAAANAATATDTTQNNSITAAFAAANAATATDTTQNNSITAAFAAANSAGVYANSAFTAANSAGSLSVQSAFNTANAAFLAANSAGSYANSAFAAANSAGSLSVQSAFDTANAAFLAANAATATDTTQNNSITAAFAAANSAGSYANSAFAAANSAGSYANSAFAAANSAGSLSVQSAFNTANAAFLAANSATATDTTQNNSITASFVHANSSFGAANVSANLTLSFGATTILEVTHSGSAAYLFSQYDSLNNPNVSTFSATTLGFKLNVAGHPFQIRLGNNTANFDTGLVHVSPTGTLSYGSAAQGQTSGTLFWRIPHDAVGNYKYRCTNHPSVMIGEINVANTAGIYFVYNS